MGGTPQPDAEFYKALVQGARRDRGRPRAGRPRPSDGARSADRVAGGPGGALRAAPGRAAARGRHRGRELSPLHRSGLPAADQLARRDGRGGPAGGGEPGAARRGPGRSRRWRSSFTTRTTTCACWTGSTASGRPAPLRHPDRGAAAQRARRRAGGAAGEVPRRAAGQALPAGRLVGPAALARDAGVRGVGHPLSARAAGHPARRSSRRAAGWGGPKRSSRCWTTSAGPRRTASPATSGSRAPGRSRGGSWPSCGSCSSGGKAWPSEPTGRRSGFSTTSRCWPCPDSRRRTWRRSRRSRESAGSRRSGAGGRSWRR